MVADFENMQSLEDFVQVTPIKRKRKATPIEKPKKKKQKIKVEPAMSPLKKPIIIGMLKIGKNLLFTLFYI